MSLIRVESDVWKFLIFQIEFGVVDVGDMTLVFQYLHDLQTPLFPREKFASLSSLRSLQESERSEPSEASFFPAREKKGTRELLICPRIGDSDSYRYPERGLPYIRFQKSENEIVVVSIFVNEIEVILSPQDPI